MTFFCVHFESRFFWLHLSEDTDTFFHRILTQLTYIFMCFSPNFDQISYFDFDEHTILYFMNQLKNLTKRVQIVSEMTVFRNDK